MGKGTGTGTERAGQCGRNGTGNGEREGPVRTGQASEEDDEKTHVGRGWA